MLTKRQKEVAQAIYAGALTEQDIISQFNLSPAHLRRWLDSEEFQNELDRLSQDSLRQTRAIITRYGPIAAATLVDLLNSEKPDTARRAALDLIDRCLNRTAPADTSEDPDQTNPQLSTEQAQKMLLTLAEGLKQ